MTSSHHPPVVLLHAFPFHSGLFSETALPPAWQLVTPDRRGFGRTPLTTAGDPVPAPGMDVLVADLLSALDDVGAERVVLGGVSMGGYVALAFLARHPERVAGLVLADTRCTPDGESEREGRLQIARRADDDDIASGADAVAPLVAGDTDPDVRARLEEMAAEAPAASIAWAQRAMAGRDDTGAALAAVDVPTLVVVGEQDRLTPVAAAEHLQRTARDATLVVLPGVGHLTPAEAPARFNAALADWLDDHEAELR